MSNLKIKDIETLERLSLDDMEQVVGGRCPEDRRSSDISAQTNNLNVNLAMLGSLTIIVAPI